MRELTIDDDRVVVDGDELDIPWAELPARLEELAVIRLLATLAKAPDDAGASLWAWTHPLAAMPPPPAPTPGAPQTPQTLAQLLRSKHRQ